MSVTKITIPEIVPSNNVLLRKHWAVRAKMIAFWYNLVRVHSRHAVWMAQKPKKFKVIITRYAPRPLDIANLYGGIDKLIVDNLKSRVRKKVPVADGKYTYRMFNSQGLIYDDNPKYLDLICKQVKVSNRNKKMEIIIEPSG